MIILKYRKLIVKEENRNIILKFEVVKTKTTNSEQLNSVIEDPGDSFMVVQKAISSKNLPTKAFNKYT